MLARGRDKHGGAQGSIAPTVHQRGGHAAHPQPAAASVSLYVEAMMLFLSHASADKPRIDPIVAILKRDAIEHWYDKARLLPGDDLVNAIDAAIEKSAVFVVFWSKNSAQSAWVTEELTQARYRRLKQNDCRIVTVRLDAHPLPTVLDRILWLDGCKLAAEEIADELRKTAAEGGSSEASQPSNFENRQEELEGLEQAWRTTGISTVLIDGLPGIGKRTLVRKFLAGVGGPQHVAWLTIPQGASPALGLAQIASALDASIVPAEHGDWLATWRETLLPLLKAANSLVVIEQLAEAVENGRITTQWVSQVIADMSGLSIGEGLSLVVISDVAIELDQLPPSRTTVIRVPRLAQSYTKRLIGFRLGANRPRREVSAEQLDAACALVAGHPLCAELLASHATRVGVDLALAEPGPVLDRVRSIVSDLLARYPFTEPELHALAQLSLLRVPMTRVELGELRISAPVLSRLVSSMMVEPSGSTNRFAIHPLVGQYLRENRITHQQARAAHQALGAKLRELWEQATEHTPNSIKYGAMAAFHLLAGGRPEDARVVRWALVSEGGAAVQSLYRAREYTAVVAIYEDLVASLPLDLGTTDDSKVEFYYLLAKAKSVTGEADRQEVKARFDALLRKSPTNRYYWQGWADVAARWDSFQDAYEGYLQARALSNGGDPFPSHRLAVLLFHNGRGDDALKFIDEALKRRPDDSEAIADRALILEGLGRVPEAVAAVRSALARRPTDVALNHRAGLLFKRQGDSHNALQHLQTAVRSEPQGATVTALASLYLDLGRITDAASVMESYPSGYRDAGYFTVWADIHRRQTEFTAAARSLKDAERVEGRRTVQIHACWAHLRMDEAEKAAEAGAIDFAQAKIVESAVEISRGLALSEDNQGLLNLRNLLDSVKKRVHSLAVAH